MSKLNTSEKDIAINLINSGYQKAAESFSMLTKQRITIKPTHVDVSGDDLKVLKNIKSDNDLILITTNIIGELSGKSYLLFNEDEAEQVYCACMPFNEDESTRVMETEAILKELDNILSAAVITEFSNYLDTMIFGDVPVYAKTNQSAVKEKILNDFSDSNTEDYYMVADTHFVSESNANLRPQFVWKLTGDFVEKIKTVSSQAAMK